MSDCRTVTPGLLRAMPLPSPPDDADKQARGTVLVAAGSLLSPGAAILSGLAALRAGAGRVALAVPRQLAIPIGLGFPEAGIHAFPSDEAGHPRPRLAGQRIVELFGQVDAAVVGPGFADERSARKLADRVLEATPARGLVLDALALTGLWDTPARTVALGGKVVITPHAGEMARLTGRSREHIEAEPVPMAREAAARLNCIVVLKGATTVIAAPEGDCYLHAEGVVGLGTAGSGDVLAGILGAMLARGASPLQAAIWAVHLHAQAGRVLSTRVGPLGFLARELPPVIPELMPLG